MNLRRQSTALAGSLAFVTTMVIALAMLQREKLPNVPVAKPISISRLAAPPPPPPSSQRQRPTPQSISIELGQARTAAVTLPPAELPQTMTIDDLDAPIPDMQVQNFDLNLTAAVQEFGLAQLDDRPRLLTPLSIRFPDSLRRQGVDSVSVEVQVVIDQSGAVTLRRIIENPYDELEPQIRSLMRRARFSPPQKDGERVRAAFVWPLVLRSQ